MEFTTSSSRRRAGATLAEMLVALGAGSLVLAAIMGISLYTTQTLQTMIHYAEMEQKNQVVLDTLSQTIRGAERITAYSTNQLTLLSAGQSVTFTYNPQARTLTRSVGGTNTVLLSNAWNLAFSVYMANVASNSFYQYPATTNSNARSVVVSWNSKDSVNGKTQTETARSARILLRSGAS